MSRMNQRRLPWLAAVILVLAVGCSDDSVEPAGEDLPDFDFWSESRLAWTTASVPGALVGYGPVDAVAASRVETIRWYQPRERVTAREMDPDLTGAARDKTVPTLELFMRAEDGAWDPEDWGGIMGGLGPVGERLPGPALLEFWINDFRADPTERSGKLHFEFGFMSEDHVWPLGDDHLPRYGTYQNEDANRDYVFILEEDTGLGGINDRSAYDADYGSASDPYPNINSTRENLSWDNEDVDGDGVFERNAAYFRQTVDLALASADVDVLRDYDDVGELAAAGRAWRRFRLPLDYSTYYRDIYPDPGHITHLRIWFEDDMAAGAVVRLQLAGMNFVRADEEESTP